MKLLIFILLSISIFAHPGKIDKYGGHFNKKTGKYHFHKGKNTKHEIKQIRVKLLYISDGDTISVMLNNKKSRIRFYGIDAPETTQRFGLEAKQHLQYLLSRKKITIEIIDKDRYGRIVANVYANNKLVNLIMVKRGYAWWYKYHAKRNFDLKQAQHFAKNGKLGLWKDKNPIAPWDYRKKRKKKGR